VNNGVGVHLVTSRDYDASDVSAKGAAPTYTDIENSRQIVLRTTAG
jgi:hypothetical protein